MTNLTKEAQETLGRIPGIGPVLAEKLYLEGFTSAYDLSRADPEVLGAIPGIGKVKTNKIMDAASEFFQDQLEAGEVDVRGRSLKKKAEEEAAAAPAEGEDKAAVEGVPAEAQPGEAAPADGGAGPGPEGGPEG
jgi:Holliday junction resolvasome RuvABC DNA-binding subunit